MIMKYAVFVIGERKSGKSTLIRSLTGCGGRRAGRIWRVKSLSGQPLKALIIDSSPQELGMSTYPPHDFPQAFEKKFGVSRNDYDLLISALELNVKNPYYSYREYVDNTRKQGFDVRMTAINKRCDETQEDVARISEVQNFAQHNGIRLVLVDASGDPNVASSSVRNALYP